MKPATRSYDGKASVILEAAQKRFAQYGVEKTTMREIAGDLNMTKGSLYYYFPDKEALYTAVIELEHSEFLRLLEDALIKISDPAEGLRIYVIKRLGYFRKLINLSRLRAEAYTEYKPLIAGSMKKLREDEVSLVKAIMDKGVSDKIFDIKDTKDTAILFLDFLRGLRSTLVSNKSLMVIDDDEFEIMTDRIMKAAVIFINGIRKR